MSAEELTIESRKRQADLMHALASSQGAQEATARLKRARLAVRRSCPSQAKSPNESASSEAFASGGFF